MSNKRKIANSILIFGAVGLVAAFVPEVRAARVHTSFLGWCEIIAVFFCAMAGLTFLREHLPDFLDIPAGRLDSFVSNIVSAATMVASVALMADAYPTKITVEHGWAAASLGLLIGLAFGLDDCFGYHYSRRKTS